MATDPPFHLRTLGRLALLSPDGGEDTALATRPRKLALLAWLALRPEQSASREQLISLFWGERDESRARNSLSDAISTLRRVLGRDAISTTGSTVTLRADAVAVDAIELTKASLRGDHARVVELHGGPFLEGFYVDNAWDFEEWRERERQRLERLFSKAAQVQCEAWLTAREWDKCREVASRWLSIGPASEVAARAS